MKSHDDGEITPAQDLNVQMDELVSTFIRSPPPRLYPSPEALFLPAQMIGLSHRGENIDVDIENVLAQNLFNTKILHHYRERHQIQAEQLPQIDLLTVEQVLKSNRKELPKRIKNIHSEWNTARVNKKWGQIKSSVCPLCHRKEEDWKHIFSCQEQDMKAIAQQHQATM